MPHLEDEGDRRTIHGTRKLLSVKREGNETRFTKPRPLYGASMGPLASGRIEELIAAAIIRSLLMTLECVH